MVSFRRETRLAIKNLQRKVNHLEEFVDLQDGQIEKLKAQLAQADKEKAAIAENAKKEYVPDALFREFLTGEEVDAETHRN